MGWSRAAVVSVALATLFAPAANAQTRALLDAPRVRSEIRVTWDPAAKKFKYQVDNDQALPRELPADALFLASRSIYVTYPRINPLRVQVTASAKAADDPSHAIIGKLLSAIVSAGAVVDPKIRLADASPTDAFVRAVPPADCLAYKAMIIDRGKLLNALYGKDLLPAGIREKVAGWSGAIDTAYGTSRDGASAINAGIIAMNTLVKTLTDSIETAEAVIRAAESEAVKKEPADCQASVTALALDTLLTNPRGRLAEIQRLKAAIGELQNALRTTYAEADGKWSGPDGARVNYQISEEITATPAKMQTVTIKAVGIALKVDDVTSGLTVVRQDVGSGTFTVRRYSSLAPEIGVGAVFGFINTPQYGTAQNAEGQTIVARVPDDEVEISPGLMVNFPCRCGLGPFLTPMFQIGASASTDVPALLVGGGLRLFGIGNGDVGLGGGWIIGWVKDLQELEEGDIVSGTKDIEGDLGFGGKPRVRGYFTVQYKF